MAGWLAGRNTWKSWVLCAHLTYTYSLIVCKVKIRSRNCIQKSMNSYDISRSSLDVSKKRQWTCSKIHDVTTVHSLHCEVQLCFVRPNMSLWTGKPSAVRPQGQRQTLFLSGQSLLSVSIAAVQFVPAAQAFRKRCNTSNTRRRRSLSTPPLLNRSNRTRTDASTFAAYISYIWQGLHGWLGTISRCMNDVCCSRVSVPTSPGRAKCGWQRKLEWQRPWQSSVNPLSPRDPGRCFIQCQRIVWATPAGVTTCSSSSSAGVDIRAASRRERAPSHKPSIH